MQIPEHTLVINFDDRSDDRKSIERHLRERSLPFSIFPAIRPKPSEITIESIRNAEFQNGNFRAAFKTNYPEEILGARLSTLGCLQEARSRGYETVLVLEDDMRLIGDWREVLNRAIADAPTDWFQIHLSGKLTVPGQDVSPHLTRVWNLLGSKAILFHRQGYDANIRALEECRSERDVCFNRHIHLLGRGYLTRPHAAKESGSKHMEREEPWPPMKEHFEPVPAMRWSGHPWPVRNIHLPERTPYNLSLLRTPLGIICTYRAESAILCAFLNEDHSMIPGTHQRLPLNNNADPRLVYCGGEIYMSTSYFGEGLHNERIELRRLVGISGAMKMMEVGKFHTIDSDPSYVKTREKNWAPFEHGGELFYVHQVNPHRILKVDLRAGRVKLVAETMWCSEKICHSFPGDDLRLNSPPVRLSDGTFLSTFHKRVGGDFSTWYYRFEGFPPFAPVAVGRSPVIIGQHSKGKVENSPHDGCIFITGMSVDSAQDRVELTGGYNDGYAIAIDMSLSEVLADMVEAPRRRDANGCGGHTEPEGSGISIGINGDLQDAIFKMRILKKFDSRTITLWITPICAPLISLLEAVDSVAQVKIDTEARSSKCHGERTIWSEEIQFDTTYRAYPTEWIVNFVGARFGMPRTCRDEWFGAFANALGVVEPLSRPTLFLGRVSKRKELRESFLFAFPGGEVVESSASVDFLDRGRMASKCLFRVVGFDEDAALLSILGIECIVDRGSANEGHKADIFRLGGQTIVESHRLVQMLRRKLIEHIFGAEFRESGSSAKLAIGIPTICCGDLLEESLAVLERQLQPTDLIVVVDNGKQGLSRLLSAKRTILKEPERNLGVAGSWNLITATVFCEYAADDHEWVVILNDDISLGPRSLQAIREELFWCTKEDVWFVRGPYGFCTFAIRKNCWFHLGLFDEKFFPAYFEDNDFWYRIRSLAEERAAFSSFALSPEVLRISETARRRPELKGGFNRNGAYFREKWGGHPDHERFTVPFDDVQWLRLSHGQVGEGGVRSTPIVTVYVSASHDGFGLTMAVESLLRQTLGDFTATVSVKCPGSDRMDDSCPKCRLILSYVNFVSAKDRRFQCPQVKNTDDGVLACDGESVTTPFASHLDDQHWFEANYLEVAIACLRASRSNVTRCRSKVYDRGCVVFQGAFGTFRYEEISDLPCFVHRVAKGAPLRVGSREAVLIEELQREATPLNNCWVNKSV